MMSATEDDEDFRTLVIDNGSHTCKAGFAGDSAPTAVVPTVVGRLFYQGATISMGFRDMFVGTEVFARKQIVRINHPIENSIVTNWDNMERVWQHIFYKNLKVAADEHPLLVTEALRNPRANSEKMVEILFETFNPPLLYIARQPALALHSTGRSTGLVVDVGDGVTHIAPILYSKLVKDAVCFIPMGGKDLTSYLMKLLTEKGHPFTTADDHDTAMKIKEKLCYVTLNTAEEVNKSSYKRQSYKLSYGKKIIIGEERFLCSEVLFQPDLIGKDVPGLHEAISIAIAKCDVSIRKEMYSNIVLSGGSASLPGLSERLTAELTGLAPASANVKVVTPSNPGHAAWIGGSILGANPNFNGMCISKEEYEDMGPSVVHKKCHLY